MTASENQLNVEKAQPKNPQKKLYHYQVNMSL